MKTALLATALLTLSALAESMGLGPRGLSGWQGLSCSDVLQEGTLRAGASLEYTGTSGGSILAVPLRGCWGAAEDLELSAVITLVPVDEPWSGSFLGDMTLAGGWLYETTRGGTALKLTGRLSLPTGEEFRDRGTELAFGGVTSTTFLDFRLSMSGEYALNGGRNPFEDDIRSVFYFTGGGTSYISPDFLLCGSLNGSTDGDLEAGASVQFILTENLTADCGVFAGLEGYEEFGISAGFFWTGTGF